MTAAPDPQTSHATDKARAVLRQAAQGPAELASPALLGLYSTSPRRPLPQLKEDRRSAPRRTVPCCCWI